MENHNHIPPTAPTSSACPETAWAAAGTYGGVHTLCMKLSGYHPPNFIGFQKIICSKLELSPTGTYTFATQHTESMEPTQKKDRTLYFESGTYTLDGEEITLIPDKASFCLFRPPYSEIRPLTPEEQSAMTTKGTVKEGTVTAKMRWSALSPEFMPELAMERQAE